MALRLALVIDGDQKGASAAVEKTITDVKRVAAAAAKANDEVGSSAGRNNEKARNAVKLTEQQLAQMQFQLQDIAVGLTSGQSPFTVMMQQGSQVAQMFKSGTGVLGALKAVGAGVATFLTNPLNLATLGFGLAATAAVALFQAVSQGGKANAVLERQEELVRRIAENWDTAAGKLKTYATETRNMQLLQARQLLPELEKVLEAQIAAQTGKRSAAAGKQGYTYEAVAGVDLNRVLTAGSTELVQEVNKFRQQLREGHPDLRAFADAIASVANASDDKNLRTLVLTMQEHLAEAIKTEQDVRQQKDLIKGLGGDTETLNKALGKAGDGVSTLTGKLLKLGDASYARGIEDFTDTKRQFAGKSLLDLIGQSEGTDRGRGYNETLAYGAFTGGPVDLVTKSLREVLALQQRMLADKDNTFNSSALGRYQITRETLLDFMPKLGLTADTIFTPDVQDRIALAIANSTQGALGSLRSRWTSLRFVDDQVLQSTFQGSLSQRSSVAQSIASQQVKTGRADDAAAARDEQALKRWNLLLLESAANEAARSTAIGKSAYEQAKLTREQQLWAQARSTLGDRLETDKALNAQVTKEIERQAAAYGRLAEATELAKRRKEAAAIIDRQNIERLDDIRQQGAEITSTFWQARDAGQSWGSALGAVLDSIKTKATSLLDKFIDQLLFGKQGTADGGLAGGFLGSLSQMLTGAFMGGGSLYAAGEAFAPVAFAGGASFTNKVHSAATPFTFGRGLLGVMAERGEEAVMPLRNRSVAVKTPAGESRLPLARMSDGALGVEMATPFADGGIFGEAGSSGRAAAPVINNVVKNYGSEKVTTSAKRRNDGTIDLETTIGSVINRHIARGGADSALNGRFSGLSRRTEQVG